MRRVGLVLLAFACVFVPAHAFGSQMLVPSDIGLTARGVALGNAMTAVAGDPSAIYHNPAILATYEHSQINTGYLFTDPSLSGGPKGNTNEFDEGNKLVLSNLVLSLRSMFKNNHPVAFGLSMYFDRNFRSLINFIDVEEGEGYFYRYGRASTAASMALGFAVTDWLYLGGGTVITLRGETDFQVNTDMAGNTSNEGMILDARLYYSPVASAFADFEVVDIGVTYHGENYGRFGDITVDAEATVGDSPLSELPLVMSFQDTFMPQNIALGFAFPLGDAAKIAVDGVWYNWGRFDERVAEDDLPREDVKIDFVDTYVPRAGIEYNLAENFPLRLGYSYQMTPMRTPGDRTNVFLDNDRHVGSIGLGYTMEDPPVFALPVSLDAAYFHQYLVPDEYETADGFTYESEGNVNGGVVTLNLQF